MVWRAARRDGSITPCLPSYGSPQPSDRRSLSPHAQIPFPIATPTLHTAAIAAHRRNPAHQSVENTAPYTIRRAVASGAYASVRGMTRDVRADTAGCGGRVHELFCPMMMGRYRLAPHHGLHVDRERFLPGSVSCCHASTFILPVDQRCLLLPFFHVARAFNYMRGEG